MRSGVTFTHEQEHDVVEVDRSMIYRFSFVQVNSMTAFVGVEMLTPLFFSIYAALYKKRHHLERFSSPHHLLYQYCHCIPSSEPYLNNGVLRTSSSLLPPDKTLLPWPFHSALCQVSSWYCSFPRSFNENFCRASNDLSPSASISPRAKPNNFSCPSDSTQPVVRALLVCHSLAPPLLW